MRLKLKIIIKVSHCCRLIHYKWWAHAWKDLRGEFGASAERVLKVTVLFLHHLVIYTEHLTRSRGSYTETVSIYFFHHFLLTTFIFGDVYFPSFFFSLFFTFVALRCHLYRPRQVLNAAGRKFLSDRQKSSVAQSHLHASQASSHSTQAL